MAAAATSDTTAARSSPGPTTLVSSGPRVSFLISQLADASPLKATLEACLDKPMAPNSFAFAHRGAPLQFPEHTRESAIAAARLGAGTIECDVTFTKDQELVCRHAQNDLHFTTNILVTPLAAKCAIPFTPYNPDTNEPATAECRTSDLTLAEWKTLRGKMEGFNPKARTVDEYVQTGTPGFRTNLYAGVTSGTLMSLADSIELFEQLGVRHTPEAKEFVGEVTWPRANFVQKILDTYKAFHVDPTRVFLQSFLLSDILYVAENEPAFAPTAVFLDSMTSMANAPVSSNFSDWVGRGVRIWAPPLFALLDVDNHDRLVASQLGKDARAAGLDIVAWSLERQGVLANAGDRDTWYYQTVLPYIQNEGFALEVIDVFVQELQLVGLFSDWSAAPVFYANCVGYGHNPVGLVGARDHSMLRPAVQANGWLSWQVVLVAVVALVGGVVVWKKRARGGRKSADITRATANAPLLPRADGLRQE